MPHVRMVRGTTDVAKLDHVEDLAKDRLNVSKRWECNSVLKGAVVCERVEVEKEVGG